MLTSVEEKVFEALLDGPRTVTELAHATGIHRPNVYDTLQRLITKGAVVFSTKGRGRVFQTADAQTLLQQEEERKAHLNELISRMQVSATEKSEVSAGQGVQAIYDMLNSLLERRQPISVYGVPKEALSLLQPFILNFHARRIGAKVEMKHIYNEDAQERISYLNSLSHTAARYLPKKYNSPVSTNICGDTVAMIHWGGSQPVVITIRNKALSGAYQKYFELLWQEARP